MNQNTYVECRFFIPMVRDGILSDGKPHETDAWEWLVIELMSQFDGLTESPGLYRGAYKDPDTGEQVNDESKQFTIALAADRLDDLRAVLRQACTIFQQKCIYLSVAGQVEFLAVPR